MGGKMINAKLAFSWARNAHILMGALWVVLLVYVLGWSHWYCYVGTGVVLAALKEFLYDQYFESPEVRGSNLADFLQYLSGIAAGLLVCYLRTKYLAPYSLFV